MVKKTIKETVNEYDKDGHLVKQTVTETTEDDDTQYYSNPWPGGTVWTTTNVQTDGAYHA